MSEIQKTRKVLTIFLGSPSDLEEERRITRNVVDDLNRNFGNSINWSIELLGWEDTLPAYRRPQEQINMDLMKCDLFIGLLNRRWGTPSGKFGSGFEEEFEISQSRRNGNVNHPEIWLFFKDIPPDLIRDPGDQLKLVLDFKRKIESERRLLYQTFPSAEKWERLLSVSLLKFVLEKNNYERESNALGQSNKPRKNSKDKSKAPRPKGKGLKASQEIVKVLSLFQSQQKSQKKLGIPNTKTARLYLFAQTQFSRQNSTEILNHHVVNTLFAARSKINFTDEEAITLIRAMIKDRNDFVPGWYWFKSIPSKVLYDLILSEAQTANVEENRKASWEFLILNQIFPPKDSPLNSEDLKLLGEEKKPEVQEAGIKYLNLIINQTPLMMSPEDKSKFANLFEDSKTETSKIKATDFLSFVDGGKSISYSTHPFIYKFASEIPSEDLVTAIDSGSREVKVFSARELEKRKLIDLKLGTKLIEDSDATLVGIGIRTIIKAGLALSPSTIRKLIDSAKAESESNSLYGLLLGNESEEIISLLFSTYTFEQLQEQLDWFSQDSHIAYKVIADKYFELFKTTLRTDLDNDFQNLRENSISKMRGKFGSEAEQIIEGYLKPDLYDFILQKHVAAGLSALVINGDKTDIKFARKYSKSMTYHTRDLVFKMFERFSDVDDHAFLAAQLKGGNSSEKILAAKILLNDAIEFDGWPKRLLESGDISLFNLSLIHCEKIKSKDVLKFVKPYLYNEGDDFRESALAFFVLRQTEPQLEKMLNEYYKKERYFYNIVVWLDRILFSPAGFRESFKNILTKKLI